LGLCFLHVLYQASSCFPKIFERVYRVLRKYLNHNSMKCEQFDCSRFRDLCKKQ